MDISIIKLLDTFQDNKTCEAYFIEKRFPNGVYCVQYNHTKVYAISSESQCQKYKCAQCKRKFNVLTGTVFESTKLPL